jgi:hypothetical protein
MTTLTDLESSQWKGKAELWLDPAGNDVVWSDCTLQVVGGRLTYTWSFKGEEHAGSVTPKGEVVEFQDSFHASTPMECATVGAAWSLLEAFGTYAAGEGPRWGWRLSVSLRPTDELVLQMTNVCPWGEDGRAVRMVATRV